MFYRHYKMLKKIKLPIKPFKIFGRVISQWFCLFFFLVSHILYAQIHISDGATLYVEKDSLINVVNEEKEKGKIYIVSGTVVSNLETKQSYDIVKISPIQTSSQLSEKRKKLDQKEKKALAHKTSPQKKTVQPQPKINFFEGNSNAHLSFSELHFNNVVLTQHENQNHCIEAKQSVRTLFLTSIKGHAPNYYYSNHYASQYSTSLLGRAPPLLS